MVEIFAGQLRGIFECIPEVTLKLSTYRARTMIDADSKYYGLAKQWEAIEDNELIIWKTIAKEAGILREQLSKVNYI